ncbi:MAG TPA: hypothetical protein VK756_00710 [Solirubrobacteraceae bacterium]|jgi:capsular polysaccharide biosynthesis protein|nr:hypothetical protein [Solirubrobacteraceae bacterium]
MELMEVIKIIRSRRLATLAIVALAVLAAVGTRLATRSAPKGAATVQILVDSPSSALANLVQNTTPLTARAAVFAQVMASEAVIEEIGKAAAVPPHQITAEGPYSGSGQKLDVVTPSEARGTQLLAQTVPYKLTFVAQENEPVVTASVQAPTEAAAARLANGIYPGTLAYVESLEKSLNTPSAERVTIRELGPPQAGTVSTGAGMTVAAVAALGVLLLGGLILIGLEGVRRQALASAPLEPVLTASVGNGSGNGHAKVNGNGKTTANGKVKGKAPVVAAPKPAPDAPAAAPPQAPAAAAIPPQAPAAAATVPVGERD